MTGRDNPSLAIRATLALGGCERGCDERIHMSPAGDLGPETRIHDPEVARPLGLGPANVPV